MNKSANTAQKIIQYLVDVAESLNCSVDALVNVDVFQNTDQIKQFVNYSEEGKNFCVLKKNESNKEHLFFIPVFI